MPTKSARLLPLAALLLGLASAFAFQPVGWWPLMPLAFAGLAELLRRTDVLEADGRPALLRSGFQRGVKRLPVRWTAA